MIALHAVFHLFRELAAMPINWVAEVGGPVVVASRVRLARNLADVSFSDNVSDEVAAAIGDRLTAALSCVENDFRAIPIGVLAPEMQQFFCERRLLHRRSLPARVGLGIALLRTRPIQLRWNVEDHIKISCTLPGLCLEDAYALVDGMDDALSSQLPIAFDSELGYLTADPGNVGTGLRASLLLFLPAIVLEGNATQLVDVVRKAGCAITGANGMGSSPDGFFFQVFNRCTLGESEKTLLGRVHEIGEILQKKELQARTELWEKSAPQLRDRFARILAILTHAQLMPLQEAVELLVQIRLAACYGMLPNAAVSRIDRLLVEICPCHLQLLHGEWVAPELHESLRAELLRKVFAEEEFLLSC
ncbi:MAG: hypothetical protein LBP65_00140 [Puniceicoccales bacterium]|jgi:protein arginine kinase|nr:hypothetical protein [Puniceicoccales bacterium]